MFLAPGTRLGPYEIMTLAGAGGMGEVYQARDTRLGRLVAIKVLPRHLSEHPGRRERFEREARSVAALSHPNICALYDVGRHEGLEYLVMEYVEGESLDARLAQGPLPVAEAIRIAREVAEGLHAAHTRGIVHRDLKPANVRLDLEGRARILDFGLAKVSGETGPAGDLAESPTIVAPVTEAQVILGTAGYMSPEQARGAAVDRRTDVWAFGVLLFEMLSGKPLFSGPSSMDLLAAVLRAEIPWAELPAATPPGLRSLIARCLERDAERRLAGLDETRTALAELASLPAAPAAPSPSAAARPATPGPSEFTARPSSGAMERSLVVLPFANLSPDPENEYFADGLTEEVIADLSKVGALRVLSRTSSMRLKGTDKDLAAIAGDLGVAYVLEGSVRKAGSNLRITAQLIDPRTDTPLWSEKYSGTIEDVFEIQERVSRAIVDALRIRLTTEEEKKLKQREIKDPVAYDIYLRARADAMSFSQARLERARLLLEKALEVVGENALLYRGIGMVHWQVVNSGFSGDPAHVDRAESYAKKILELDPEGPHAYALLGCVAVQRGDLRGWLRNFQKALVADAGDVEALFWLAGGWILAGYPERGRPYLERVSSLDPLYGYLHFGYGISAYFSGDYDAAIGEYRKAQTLEPGNSAWTMVICQCLVSMGRIEEATGEMQRNAVDMAGQPMARLTRFLVHAARGERETALGLPNEEFKNAMWSDLQYSYLMAQSYALLGEVGEGLRWLERATERGWIHYPFMSGVDPLLANLRPDPRFAALMERVKKDRERLPDDVR